jgi:hypothetical protein
MLRYVLSLAIVVIAFFVAGGALGHPGHGTLPADSPAHVFEPVHSLWLVGLVLLVQLVFKRRSSSC